MSQVPASARIVPMGASALLVELPDTGSVLALHASLQDRPIRGQVDLAPAERSVLVVFDGTVGPDRIALLEERVGDVGPESGARHDTHRGAGDPVTIDVVYDGLDLAEAARLTGMSAEALVAAHAADPWTVAFCGFAPGFAYLIRDSAWPTVPRRDSPRTRVPAGSVGLAGEYSGVYPAELPGGWQLIGRTDARLWDLRRPDPALLTPGAAVRFRAIRAATQLRAPTGATETGATETGATEAGARETGAAPTGATQTDATPEPPAGAPGGPGERHDGGTPGFASALTVIDPGMMCLVQDRGRWGYASSGVGPSGAADRSAAAAANRAVGNDPDAAVLELLMSGAEFRAVGDQVIAVTGAPVPLTVSGASPPGDVPPTVGDPFTLPAGASIRLGRPRIGLRSYLAVRGGIDTAPVLGSRSTDTLGRLGGGRLRAGDTLPVGDAGRAEPTRVSVSEVSDDAQLAALPGPQHDWFDADAVASLRTATWTVSPQSDRTAVRLTGPAITRRADGEMPSQGLVRGAIQVPPSGELMVFLADYPVTGGYPVIAVLTEAGIDRLAQARPGQRAMLQLTGDW